MDIENEFYKRRFPDRQEVKVVVTCCMTNDPIYEGMAYLINPEGDIMSNSLEAVMLRYNLELKVGEG